MVSQPPGLLLLTPTGEISQLVVFSENECAQQANYAESHGAPEAVVRQLRTRSHVGLFLDDPDRYWYVAVFNAPPQNIDYHRESACWQAWEAQRDSFRPEKASVL